MTIAEIDRRDAEDPLRDVRAAFELPPGVIYLDGNSLGALPRATAERVGAAIRTEWGVGLITSWLGADWVNAPRRIGDKLATLLGATEGEIIAADSTSVNIFKALAAATSLDPARGTILSEATNFPTDVYMMQGIAAFSGGRLRSVVADPEAVLDRLDDTVAALLLTQVHYKTGRMRDMATVTARAHARGVPVIWDLSHSAGAVPVDLNGAKADFAVGCGYKFLSGGPGAPAYIFTAKRHHARVAPVLSGWFGHARPFAFEEDYAPAPGIERFLCGTPSILGLTALECGVDLMLGTDMLEARRKSLALGDVFIARMEQRCVAFGFALATPRAHALRGSQISYAHPNGYEIGQALKERGVIGDFRVPDILRFGLTPLYLRYRDVYDAVEILHDICASRAWDDPRHRERGAVT